MSTAAVSSNLSSLAEVARREHGLALQAGESMLLHAVQAGEALLEAQSQVEEGGWGRWLAANFTASDRTAKQYMRIARGRELVLASGARTLVEAERIVPALTQGSHRKAGSEKEEREAREMHRRGATFQAIAEHFGIAHRTAHAWVIPDYRERRNQELREERQLARRARERKGSKAALRKAGVALSELYANCERMQDVLAQARQEVTTAEGQAALGVAEESYRQMRDDVVRALGAEAGQQSPKGADRG